MHRIANCYRLDTSARQDQACLLSIQTEIVSSDLTSVEGASEPHNLEGRAQV